MKTRPSIITAIFFTLFTISLNAQQPAHNYGNVVGTTQQSSQYTYHFPLIALVLWTMEQALS